MSEHPHLTTYLAEARWFAGKGREYDVTGVRRIAALPGPPAVTIDVVTVTYRAPDGTVQSTELYQMPLSHYAEPQERIGHAHVGPHTDDDLGFVHSYDAVHDRAAMAVYLLAFADTDLGTSRVVGGLTFHRIGDHELDTEAHSTLFSGEQSNSSVAFGEDSLLKVFRRINPGRNPDIEIHGALTEAHNPNVAALYGWIEATPDGMQSLDLGMIQQFLRTASDGWDLALSSVRNLFAEADLHADEVGGDFAGESERLGAAVAEVHEVLREHFPTHDWSAEDLATLSRAMQGRLDAQLADVPELAPHEAAVRATFDRVATLDSGITVQRIHGDLHLGQTLRVVHNWKLVDFEGEPAKPLADRVLPDSPWRDVAGMLRSFDYAARSVERDFVLEAGDAADQLSFRAVEWVERNRAAFLDGYLGGRELSEAERILVAAYEADKAVYEVGYEARNRPTWITIPLSALAKLQGPRRRSGEDMTTPSGPPSASSIGESELDQLVAGEHGDPHLVLGPHVEDGPDGQVVVRVLKPLAESVFVTYGGRRSELRHVHAGVWEGVLDVADAPDYRVEVGYAGGQPIVLDDPYRFLPTLGQTDLHLINEGRHEQLWQVLGAHVQHYAGDVTGTSFSVWAPQARGVRLKGDFNSWDGREHPMRQLGHSGVWELFVPDVAGGASYKFAVLGSDGQWREKADPMAFHTEVPPATSSVVFESRHQWADQEWMTARAEGGAVDKPMSVYEVHLASWRRGKSYAELGTELAEYCTDLGFTHVEFLPVMEHPFGGSWGYQVTSYFAPTSRFGDPDGFRLLVDTLHQHGIGVILDWVPAHFPKDEFALARFDGTPLYEDPNPARGEHPDWGTYVFNFGRREVRNFLVANALYWLEEFHADGIRVDAVASMLYLDYSREPGEWTPNVYGGRENLEAKQFLQEMNATVYRRVPGAVTIAEESTSWPGVTRPTSQDGLGFGFKWNMGWMHDSLSYVQNEPVHRSWHHAQLTFSLVYAYSENYVLPISHDEVVHGKGSLLRKMPGDRWQQLANLRNYLAFMWAHPGKQLIFMGSEFAQESEWAEARELDWWLLDHPEHRGVQSLVRDLNRVYAATPALWSRDNDPSGFAWLDANDAAHNVFSFVRFAPGAPPLVCVANFSAVPHHDYRIGLPAAGEWREVLNTDAEAYAGSGVGNLGSVTGVAQEFNGQPASASMSLPPLGTVWLQSVELPEKPR